MKASQRENIEKENKANPLKYLKRGFKLKSLPVKACEDKEADSGSSNAAVLRDDETKESTHRVQIGNIKPRTHLKESYNNVKNSTKYRVVLIQEGLGNLRDCFYYTKECLKYAPSTFEGVKCYADHPTSIEESTRPERSTRDIIGHFENVKYEESQTGRGYLIGDLVTLPGAHYDWARSLLSNALDYAKRYQESDFVGFSINAAGEAMSVPIDEFVARTEVTDEEVALKLRRAREDGVQEIRPVMVLKDAISCDLVTEAGAGGKILKMIEGEKKPDMSKKKKGHAKESDQGQGDSKGDPKKGIDSSRNGGDGSGPQNIAANNKGQGDGPASSVPHDDEEQDRALFAQMIAQYLGDEHAGNEEALEMAKHAYGAYQGEGLQGEEAYQAAGNHLKMALKIGGRLMDKPNKETHGEEKEEESMEKKQETEAKKESEVKESEKKQEEVKAEEDKKTESLQESEVDLAKLRAELIKEKAENAKLSESLKKYELTDYLDKQLSELKWSRQRTNKVRETIGELKSKVQIDETIKIFKAVMESEKEEAKDDSFFVFTEKQTVKESDPGAEGKVSSFSDCLN